MAYTAADVEKHLGVDEGSLDAEMLDRVIAAVDAYAVGRWNLTDPDDRHDEAMIMQAASLWRRRHSPSGVQGSGDQGAITISRFDPDVEKLLADRLITAGLFGPSENFVEA